MPWVRTVASSVLLRDQSMLGQMTPLHAGTEIERSNGKRGVAFAGSSDCSRGVQGRAPPCEVLPNVRYEVLEAVQFITRGTASGRGETGKRTH